MSSEKSLTPQIRFKGFTEAWEQRKLNDIAEVIGGGTPDTNNPSYWDGDIDWYSPAELGEQIYAIGSRRRITKEGYKNSSAKLLPANKTILFTSRAGIGTTAILCRSACTNQGFQSLVINDNTDLYFIYSISSRIKDFAISKASGSTFLEISGKQLATMNLFLPQLNEQRKIGQYFRSLDNLITLHQRKLDALKKIKSALLEKMFPKDGSDIPEIRFAGFTEAWEQRKLSDIGEVITGSTPSTQHSEYYSEDGIPWVTPTDIVDNIIHDTPRKLSPLGEKVGRVVPANTILVTCIASIGKNTMLANTGSFNQQINGLVPDKKKYDSYFLLTESFHWSSKMKREAAAGTMQIVNKNEFSAIDTYVPEWAEQKAIGNYFRNIDNLITLHQRKLDALKKIKSALLEKMFV